MTLYIKGIYACCSNTYGTVSTRTVQFRETPRLAVYHHNTLRFECFLREVITLPSHVYQEILHGLLNKTKTVLSVWEASLRWCILRHH